MEGYNWRVRPDTKPVFEKHLPSGTVDFEVDCGVLLFFIGNGLVRIDLLEYEAAYATPYIKYQTLLEITTQKSPLTSTDTNREFGWGGTSLKK